MYNRNMIIVTYVCYCFKELIISIYFVTRYIVIFSYNMNVELF